MDSTRPHAPWMNQEAPQMGLILLMEKQIPLSAVSGELLTHKAKVSVLS